MNSHTTFPWNTVKTSIARVPESPIGILINYVIEAELSKYLYLATYLQNIRIGRSENFSRNDGELTVEYLKDSDSVIFNYFESIDSEPWVKECSSKEITTTFKHIISKRLRWVKIDE